MRDPEAHEAFRDSLRHMRSLYHRDFDGVADGEPPLPVDRMAC